MKQPKYLDKQWGKRFFVLSKAPKVNFSTGEDISDFINFINAHESVLNRHKLTQTLRTQQLASEVLEREKGFLHGFKRVLNTKRNK